MSNVQEALKAAIEVIEQAIPDKRGEFEEQQKLYENYPNLAYKYDYLKVEADEMQQALDKCKSALSEIEKCEPVAEAIRERDRLGFSVVNVIGKLDEIIENTQEVEIDDFLHIAISIDMWNELQDALEDMPERADNYTSPQPRVWVGLTYDEIESLYDGGSWHEFAHAISEKLKQLNTKG